MVPAHRCSASEALCLTLNFSVAKLILEILHRYEPCGCGEFSTNGNYNWGGSSSSSSTASANDDDDNWWGEANGGSVPSSSNDNWWGGANSLPTATDTDDAPWWSNANSSATKRSFYSSMFSTFFVVLIAGRLN